MEREESLIFDDIPNHVLIYEILGFYQYKLETESVSVPQKVVEIRKVDGLYGNRYNDKITMFFISILVPTTSDSFQHNYTLQIF